jgi:hypothetical protein
MVTQMAVCKAFSYTAGDQNIKIRWDDSHFILLLDAIHELIFC